VGGTTRIGERLAEALGGVELAAVYTSPLVRARHTAAEVATRQNLLPNRLPGLAEIDFGELEGGRFDEIAATHPDLYLTWISRPTEAEFPAGESFAELHWPRARNGPRPPSGHAREAIGMSTPSLPFRF
jgi:broad specificity phosphatase PhoE